MTQSVTSALMVGLPESGKTTFLAALWYLLNNADDVPGALGLDRLSGDRTYLNEIRDRWLDREEIGRTLLGEEAEVVLHLAGDGGSSFDLSVPDLSGEVYRQLFEDRVWPDHLRPSVEQAEGLLLFVHANEDLKGQTIDHASEVLDSMQAMAADGEEGPKGAAKPGDKSTHADKPVPFEPELACASTKIVDLVQSIRILGESRHQVLVSVIVSAWDLLAGHYNDPTRWLEEASPLLLQFLRANPEKFAFKVWGVSAQGGDYEDAEQVSALKKKGSATERILVTDGTAANCDISRPIQWLLGELSG